MKEVWKPIDGYEGLYEVSNIGRVRSLEFRNGSGTRSRVSVMTPTDNGHGYKIVGLSLKNKRRNHYVHRLVAKAFCDNPDGSDFVDHIDHDRSNNSADNLRWVSQKDNVRHSSQLMSKPRQKPMTNTGERYISRQRRDGRYRVTVKRVQLGVFNTIEEAIGVRDEAINWQESV